ncbi:MAG: SelB C-terminal domain-containing protein, partial [Chloroflexota bacterium]
SMSGFGTVVTGTLSDGHLALGDEVVVLPSGKKGRVRGLQTHKKKEETAVPGSRTAVNVSSVAAEDVRRGEVLTRPGQYQPTRRLDARLRLLKDVSAPLRHASEVKFFVGASETMATLRLLGVETLDPGQEGWVQLELRDPVVAVRGDRYILRRPSPGETLGGGVIVDHQPKGRHKRFDGKVVQSLESLAQGSPADVLFEAALALNAAPLKEVIARSRLEAGTAQAAAEELIEAGRLVNLDGGPWTVGSLVITGPQLSALSDKTVQLVEAYHKNYPLRRGIPREELKSKLKLTPRLFNALLTHQSARNILKDSTAFVALPSHEVRFDNAQQAKVQALMRQFAANPFGPPSVKESQAAVGDEVFDALVELGQLVMVGQEVVFRREDYERMVAMVRGHIEKTGQITVAEARDIFNSSRKYILGLLEHLDATGVTVRDGDFRRLKDSASQRVSDSGNR